MKPVSSGIFTLPKKPSPRFAGNYKVLLADDDPLYLNTVSKSFEFHGKQRGDTFSISRATNRLEAQEKLQANPEPYDIMVTDNSMPDFDEGMKLLDFRQAMGAQKPKHAFMYSSDRDIESRAVEHGADGGYSKNITAPAMVKHLLESLFGPKSLRPSSPPLKRAISSPIILAKPDEDTV